jgi:transporter family-2 protein
VAVAAPPAADRHALALAVAVGSGALVALQARINGELGLRLDDALLAALVSFGTGLLAVAVLVGARPHARAALRKVGDTVWWHRLGGLGGASLVAAGTFAAPEIGVALLTVGIVAGQTTGGLLVDRVGLGPGGHQHFSRARVGGAVLCLLAVVVAAAGRGAGDADPWLLLVVVAAGFAISVQQALNGRVRGVTGDAGVATLVNFVVGTSVLLLAWLLVSLARGVDVAGWPGAGDWHLYLGGPLGATFVAVAAVLVKRLGVLRLGLAVISGQLVGAVLLDLVSPAADHGVAGATLLGAALTLVAVWVSGRRR